MRSFSILTITLVIVLLLSGCASSERKNTYRGAGIGAAAGGAIGAVAGKTKGAVLGAVIGGSLGAIAGNRMDKQARELDKIAETERTEQGLITKLKSDILFDTGKANLKPDAKTNLKQMAEIMKKYPENVLTVKGYTDNTGGAKINEILSEQRADSVKKTLVAAGLPASVIGTAGLGPSEPVADNSTTEGRQQNRRVEIEVTVDPDKIPKDAKATR